MVHFTDNGSIDYDADDGGACMLMVHVSKIDDDDDDDGD